MSIQKVSLDYTVSYKPEFRCAVQYMLSKRESTTLTKVKPMNIFKAQKLYVAFLSFFFLVRGRRF